MADRFRPWSGRSSIYMTPQDSLLIQKPPARSHAVATRRLSGRCRALRASKQGARVVQPTRDSPQMAQVRLRPASERLHCSVCAAAGESFEWPGATGAACTRSPTHQRGAHLAGGAQRRCNPCRRAQAVSPPRPHPSRLHGVARMRTHLCLCDAPLAAFFKRHVGCLDRL